MLLKFKEGADREPRHSLARKKIRAIYPIRTALKSTADSLVAIFSWRFIGLTLVFTIRLTLIGAKTLARVRAFPKSFFYKWSQYSKLFAH